MKQLVFAVAAALIAQNGKTTTLEVKNECHAQNSTTPGFELGQSEVSQYMNEMYQEAKGEMSRDLTSGNYYEYSMTPAFIPGTNTGTGNPLKSVSSSTSQHIPQRNPASDPADVLGTVDAVGSTTDGDKYVAYEAGNPNSAMVFDTNDAYAARAGYKQHSSVIHEDIRMMQLKNFLSKYVTA